MIGTVLRISWLNLKRDRVALALTFVLPIVFFSIFAGVFGEMDRDEARPIRAFVVVEDDDPASRKLAEMLRAEKQLQIVELPPGEETDRAAARERVRAGEATVAVVLPQGLGDTFRDLTETGLGSATVELLVDRSDPIADRVVQGVIQGAVFQLGRVLLSDDAEIDPATEAMPLQFELSDVHGIRGQRPSVAFFAAGLGVMFLLFAVSGRSAILIEERESGVLARMLAAKVGMTRFLVGRWLFLTLVGASQVTLMFVWAALVFGLELWTPRHLAGFAVVTAVTAAAAAGFGLMLSTACRSRAQLNGVAAVVVLTLSALGGSMFPTFLMSPGLQKLGLLTFNAWAVRGYQKIFWYEASVLEQWPQVLVVALYGLAFLIVARLLARRWEMA